MIEVPTIPDVIEAQIPVIARQPENAKFVALLKHYYDWLIQKGQPTDFIRNILQYRDIDLTTDAFREHLAASLYHVIPSTSAADKILMTKHITEFLKSKGSLESFEFIMNAIYGEIIQVDWNSDKLFRASDNEYSRRASVVIESDSPWSLVDDSEIEQTYPTPASAIIESCVTTTYNGTTLNWLKLNDKSVMGRFEVAGSVRALHNNIDLSLQYIEEYYKPISLFGDILEFSALTEEARPYDTLIVKQLNSDFRAIIETLISRVTDNDKSRIRVKVTAVTGTLGTDDLYIIPAMIENSLYTKDEYEHGIVSKSVVGISFDNSGALYTPGDNITFLAGSGLNVDAVVSDIGAGGIDTVDIIKKGYGYSVGDNLTVLNDASNGAGFIASVDKIDGIGGDIAVTTELNAFSITDGGYGYAVGDELQILGGNRKEGTPPAKFLVSSINAAWLFKGIKIVNTGSNYPKYSKIELIDSVTLAKIAGFVATPTFNTTNGISDITITSTPTISSKDLKVIVNGYGASYTANLSAGAVISFTQSNVGVNYINPEVEILGDGVGASAVPILSSGTITGITLLSGGSGYTTTTVLIKEKFSTGFVATPKIQNTTDNTGTITGLSIIDRGEYNTLPSCFDNKLITKTGIGEDATVSLDFRLLNTKLISAGNYYQTATADINGNGSGAVFNPILRDGSIGSFNIVSGGSGYTYAYITIGDGFDFVGSVNITGGVITGITIYKSGWGYNTTSSVNIIGDGINADINLLGAGNIKNGVLKELVVVSGGTGYFYGTSISAPTSQPGAIAAILTPIIVNGEIKSISSTEGEGYISTDMDNIILDAGISALMTLSVSGTGKLVSYDITSGGEGYYSQSEVTPVSISASIGTGAVLLPTIDAAGKIIAVQVHAGGQGYTGGTILSVAGGGGSGAILKPLIYQNKITDVIIENSGAGYKYGTSAFVVGDGMNANITPVVETGITSADVISGGVDYINGSTVINITDPTGTGAEIQPIIVDNTIVSLEIINKGTGYTNPVLSATIGSGATLIAKAPRNIIDFTVVDAGTGYTYADLILLGDGSINADVRLKFDKLGSIDSVITTNYGTGYTITPVVSITDTSGYGAVSKIAIKSLGGGYTVPPILILENKYDEFGNLTASGTKFSSHGKNIGSIKGISFTDNGAAYDDLPIPIFPVVATLAENAAFISGETVKVYSNLYRDISASFGALLESGDNILLESGDTLGLDVLDSSFDNGTTAKVISVDYEKNIIKLDVTSDAFFITSEQLDKLVITEDDIDIVHQLSASLDIGDVLIGEKSNAHATISYMNRASGATIAGGNGWGDFKFKSNVGKLNDKLSVLADNNRYQDYAYVVKAGRALKDYEVLLRTTVHPAGFSLFGDVVTQTLTESNILNEIGYNSTVSILFIYSIYAMYQESTIGQEWSAIDDLFGDFTKFRYVDMPISLVKDFTTRQTSKTLYRIVDEYAAPPIVTADLSKWTLADNIQVIKNHSSGPSGKLDMYKLSDLYSANVASIYNIVPVAADGRTYAFECMIKKQVNPLTYPKFELKDYISGGDIYTLVLNTESGEYKTDGTGLTTVLSVGDFWFVRMIPAVVAPGANICAKIIPAASYIDAFVNSPWANDITAIGSIDISAVVLKDITGVATHTGYIRAINNEYAGAMFYLTPTETDLIIQ